MRNALPASSYIVKNNILYYIACLVFFSFCRLDSWEDLEKSSLVLLLLVSLNCWPATRLPSGQQLNNEVSQVVTGQPLYVQPNLLRL